MARSKVGVRSHGVSRRFFGLVVAFALVLTACDWAQFRGDPAHSGVQPFETTLNTSNVGALTAKWTATTGGSVHSSPAFSELKHGSSTFWQYCESCGVGPFFHVPARGANAVFCMDCADKA